MLQTQISIAVYFCLAENFNILYSDLKNLLFIAFEFCVMHKKASPTLRIYGNLSMFFPTIFKFTDF